MENTILENKSRLSFFLFISCKTHLNDKNVSLLPVIVFELQVEVPPLPMVNPMMLALLEI